MARAPSTEYLAHTFECYPSTYVSEWSVHAIRRALNQHDEGLFYESSELVTALDRDPRVFAARMQRVDTALALPFRTLGAPRAWEGRGLAESIRAEAETLFAPTSIALPAATTKWLLRWGIMLGVAIAQIVWTARADGSRWDVEVRPWPMDRVWYDRATATYKLWTTEGTVTATPGDGKWIVYEPNGYRSWLMGAVRPLGLAWADRTMGVRDRSQHSTAHGSPSIIGTLPEGVSPRSKEGQVFKMLIRGLQNARAGLLKPFGAVIELLEAKTLAWQVFDQVITGDNEDIALILLGQVGSSKDGGSNYAKAFVHNEVRHDITAGDVTTLAAALAVQFMRPWTWVNFGRPELAPAPLWVVADPEEDARRDAIGKRHVAYCAVLEQYRLLGVPVDEDALAEQFGIVVPRTGPTKIDTRKVQGAARGGPDD